MEAAPRDLPQHRVRGRGDGLADQLREAVGKELVSQKGLGNTWPEREAYDMIIWYLYIVMLMFMTY